MDGEDRFPGPGPAAVGGGQPDADAENVPGTFETPRERGARLIPDVPLDGRGDLVPHAAWDGAAARTWNRHRSALRSFTAWAARRGWDPGDLAAGIERRPEPRGARVSSSGAKSRPCWTAATCPRGS
ncbi:hypothetical protein E1293_16550 [Actinomadura darangshiensis]|uniref:Integrase SAM-like N-terminal domain-containing protein n=1 Tax=Actinomadura darangshiensis TaxID=705336 RepID=A0A4R5BBH8_9ACTN|nr:site-specific integrase [Actinomadura darangshiensis]TDD82519.1 hypothetical protein E1293_16550 [Actinomadura darangshiensis]